MEICFNLDHHAGVQQEAPDTLFWKRTEQIDG